MEPRAERKAGLLILQDVHVPGKEEFSAPQVQIYPAPEQSEFWKPHLPRNTQQTALQGSRPEPKGATNKTQAGLPNIGLEAIYTKITR